MKKTLKTNIPNFFTVYILFAVFPFLVFAGNSTVFLDNSIPQVKFSAADVKKVHQSKGFTIKMISFTSPTLNYYKKKVVIALTWNALVAKLIVAEERVLSTKLELKLMLCLPLLKSTNSNGFWQAISYWCSYGGNLYCGFG